MKRPILRGLGVAFAVVLAVCGVVAFWPSSPVTVTIRNEAVRSIASARIAHEDGVEVAKNIAPGESRTLKFRTRGETSYQLTVSFSDGSQFSGRGGYAEAGYRFTERVSDAGIRTDTHHPYSQ